MLIPLGWRCCSAVPSSTMANGCRKTQWRMLWTTTTRLSSSDVYKHDHFLHLRIDSVHTAQQMVTHLRSSERKLLLQELTKLNAKAEESDPSLEEHQPSPAQHKQLFIVNTVPFIGFGVLDNMIMILAGEYIDQYLGIWLCISTMAAAALGNIISDLAGVGLAHYVEQLVSHLGFKHPELTSVQLESKKVRLTVNLARAIGLTVGCLIGMFPLLFFKSPAGEANKTRLASST